LGQKVKVQQQQNKKINIKNPAGAGMEHGTSCTQSGCVTTAPPSQLGVLIVVNLINNFDAMSQNVNKNSGAHIFKKINFFSVIQCIFTCMNNNIWQFLIFTGVGFTA